MSDPPKSRPPPPLQTLWAAWFGITLCGPLLSMGAVVVMGSMNLDVDFIWQGILLSTFAGIIAFSVKIASWYGRNQTLIAVGLIIGGALNSFGIFFGACVASW